MPGSRSGGAGRNEAPDPGGTGGHETVRGQDDCEFEANLDAVEAFLTAAEVSGAFDALLDDLANTVVPNLERLSAHGAVVPQPRDQFPRGTRCRRAPPGTLGAGELREYLAGDYLILYALIDRSVYLLSIKHHRQLSFDLGAHWKPVGD